jgi:hypothetical protein
MALRGHFEKGVVVLDEPAALPEGTAVEVDIVQCTDQIDSLRTILRKYSGCMTGLPVDYSKNHDYYIHGTSK